MFKDSLDFLGSKSMTQEETEANATLIKRMREFTAKMPPILLSVAPPRPPINPVDLTLTYYTLTKEDQQLIIQRSKQRLKTNPQYLISLHRADKEI